MKGLTTIDFTDLPNFTDNALLELVKNAGTTLTSLSLKNCPEISDVGVHHILKYCEKLICFKIISMPLVTLPQYLTDIIKRTPNLTEFRYFLSRVSSNCISEFGKISPIILDALNANIDRM